MSGQYETSNAIIVLLHSLPKDIWQKKCFQESDFAYYVVPSNQPNQVNWRENYFNNLYNLLIMRYKKGFNYSKSTYYFTVKAIPNNITIYRKSKEAAIEAYQKYATLGKDIEWLGKWNGKQFVEATPPVSLAE